MLNSFPILFARRREKVRFTTRGGAVNETAHAAHDNFVAWSESRSTGGDDAQLDFEEAPEPIIEAAVGEIEGDGLEVEDRADDATGADDDAETHEGAEADFGSEWHLHSPEEEDGEGGKGEVGHGGYHLRYCVSWCCVRLIERRAL